ncbi:TRAP transporter substrate-binding protein DctP [Pseudoalteromonas ostreae]|uniref:TRAP transporter substrate-binding protein n=1 Tax=Pseudoalteromonas ostreae TaxID=2774154 RepID=UPI001B395F96|nr:TRAP transporter substrate-binding protein DctP [Pseudoalteromonas ostreae]
MKTLKTGLAIALLVTIISLPALAETRLRISLQLPLKHHLGQNLLQFKQQVETASHGDLKIEIYPSAQLYKDKEVPSAVASGAIEMGVTSLAIFAGTVPAVDLFYVPFMLPSADLVRKATAPGSTVRQPLDDAILKTGARVLWWQAYGGVALLSKGDAIVNPEDMKGKKIRVFGKTVGQFAKSVGASPVVMSGSEQFLAYQRGTVDAGMTGISTVMPRKLYQVMDNLTITKHADIEFLVLINDKVWHKLSENQRVIITNASRNVEAELRKSIVKIEADAIADSKKKMQVFELSQEQIAAWKVATSSVVDTYIQNSGELGRQLVDAVKSL